MSFYFHDKYHNSTHVFGVMVYPQDDRVSQDYPHLLPGKCYKSYHTIRDVIVNDFLFLEISLSKIEKP